MQTGAHVYGDSFIAQDGTSNGANVAQGGSMAAHFSDISQSGVLNSANVSQDNLGASVGGLTNASVIGQMGAGNLASVSQR